MRVRCQRHRAKTLSWIDCHRTHQAESLLLLSIISPPWKHQGRRGTSISRDMYVKGLGGRPAGSTRGGASRRLRVKGHLPPLMATGPTETAALTLGAASQCASAAFTLNAASQSSVDRPPSRCLQAPGQLLDAMTDGLVTKSASPSRLHHAAGTALPWGLR